MFFHRATANDRSSPTSRVSRPFTASLAGTERTYVGERCSIVTCAAPSAARAGTRVTAVAPRADDDDALARVVEVVGPVLRVDHLAAEALLALEVRRVARVVVVVAAARPQEVGGHRRRVPPTSRYRPRAVARVPVGRARRGGRSGVAVHAVLARRVAEVVEDRGAVGQGGVAAPRPEPVAERVHVGVGADARVAEQVPRPAAGLAPLEDGVRRRGQVLGEVGRGADAGQAGSDDQHVDVLGRRHAISVNRELRAGQVRAYSSTNRASRRTGSVTIASRAAALRCSCSCGS